MLLFDSVLAGKRILFSGDTAVNSVEEVQECVYACASLAQPLLHGVGNLLHGYIDFNSVDLLDENCYIGGVINPIFKQGKQYQHNYDVFVRIDSPQKKDISPQPILNLSGSTEKESRGLFVMRNNNKAKGQ